MYPVLYTFQPRYMVCTHGTFSGITPLTIHCGHWDDDTHTDEDTHEHGDDTYEIECPRNITNSILFTTEGHQTYQGKYSCIYAPVSCTMCRYNYASLKHVKVYV